MFPFEGGGGQHLGNLVLQKGAFDHFGATFEQRFGKSLAICYNICIYIFFGSRIL